MFRFFKSIVFILVLGCSGEESLSESNNFLNNNLENKNIIIAGSTLDDGAVIWINQNKITLIGDSDEATGLFFQNEKIYVTGWKYGGAGSIWSLNLDGTDQTLIKLEGQYSEGQRIILHEEDIYVGGYFKNGSCYWKNGVKFNLTTNADSMTWGIQMDSENNIYNVGYYMKSHNLIPAYWKNKQRVNLNRPRQGDGEAKYIKILGNKKIMAGTVMAPHNFLGYLTKPTYWTNGARTSCQIGSVDDGWQNSEVFDLFVDEEENIYLAGFSQDMNSEYPT